MTTSESAGEAGRGVDRRWPNRDGLAARVALLRLLPSASRSLTACCAAFVLASAVLPPLFIIAVGHAVGAVGPAVHSGVSSPAARDLFWAIGAVGGVFLLQQTVVPLTDVFADQLGLRVRGEVFRRALAAAMRPATVAHLEEPRLRDLVERATDPGLYGPRLATSGLVNTWASRLGSVGALVILGLWHWWAAVLLLIALVHALARLRGAHLEMVKARLSQTQTLRRSDYLRDLLMQPVAAKEIRVFGLGPWLTGRFAAEWRVAMAYGWARRRRMAVNAAIGIAPVLVVLGALVARAVVEADGGTIDVARLVVVLQALLLASAVASVNMWDAQVELGLSGVLAMGDLERAVDQPRLRLPGARPATGLPTDAIRFVDVRFAYADTEREVFRDLNLTIPAGQSLAVVGENGAGKSTLIKLLTRMHDPTGGRIEVDGVDLREIDPIGWQRRTAAVFQDFQRYPWTAAENVALRPDPDARRLAWAAEQAGADVVVAGLEHGWDTVLSRQFGGSDLSGGQWQRIALARALYAVGSGASVLILDEPTSNLDVRQEAAFYDRFLELTRDRTTVVVSHRFSTVRRADRIAVIKDGRVAEFGPHEELLQAGGLYARMFRLQAARFGDRAQTGDKPK